MCPDIALKVVFTVLRNADERFNFRELAVKLSHKAQLFKEYGRFF